MRFSVHYVPARIVAARDISPTVRLIEIAPDGGTKGWTPGSHINLSLPIGDSGETRSYSLIGEPHPQVYRIAVKRDDQGRGGSRYMHGCDVGARLNVSEPHNNFDLSWQGTHYVLVAGGIGVTPVHSMALALAKRGAKVTVLQAARTRAELAFADELSAALGDNIRFFVSDEGNRIDAAAEVAALPTDAEIYLCGPLSLVDAFRKAWRAEGRPMARLRSETFGSSGSFAAEPFKVFVPALGLEVDVPADRSMADALEEAGVAVITDCKRGECGLCAVDIVSCNGEIDHRDVFLSDQERQENVRICACVSRVAGGAITIDTGYRTDAQQGVGF
ncbi:MULTISPECIES: PDR/VanB family oxidoreductase [unclassified Beijerinckia]|uniref:PDR/VanB family oxidoreductase n=1 Tax=unclassified Beijerinckia TaxID=2638183 RepID=UPI0008966459|nr:MULTISPECIES: PDR/VanB family oxidoreductase [unclassified Beijerinckia]MDH7797462.1 ferredoxin-NADP reductase [Beijerinckia sp. GAS462]SEC86606.1 vanillate demethylase subunit B [Beijerinckia sp. 28-YEA-48]